MGLLGGGENGGVGAGYMGESIESSKAGAEVSAQLVQYLHVGMIPKTHVKKPGVVISSLRKQGQAGTHRPVSLVYVVR